MKALREFIIVILSFVLVFLITGLGLFLSFKDVFQTSIVTEGVKSIVKSDEFTPEQQKEINDAVEKITSDKDVNELIDMTIKDMANSDGKNFSLSDETIDKFISIIENNKEELTKFGVKESEINQFISDVKDPANREEMKQEMNKGYEELNINLGNNQSFNVIQTAGKVMNPENVSKTIMYIIVIVVLIAILKWSLYEWIRPCAVSTIVASANLLIVYHGIDFITKELLAGSEIPVNINVDTLGKVAYTILAVGISSLLIYIIIKVLVKINKKNKDTSSDIKVEKKQIFTEEIPVGEKDVPIEKDPINPEKICASCGAPVSEEDEICKNCGAPLEIKKEG